MKIYTIHLDDFSKEIVLTALMEKAAKEGRSSEAGRNVRMVYGDIKEEIMNQ